MHRVQRSRVKCCRGDWSRDSFPKYICGDSSDIFFEHVLRIACTQIHYSVLWFRQAFSDNLELPWVFPSFSALSQICLSFPNCYQTCLGFLGCFETSLSHFEQLVDAWGATLSAQGPPGSTQWALKGHLETGCCSDLLTVAMCCRFCWIGQSWKFQAASAKDLTYI